MMLQPEIKIIKTDNGYVLEWSQPTDAWDAIRTIQDKPRPSKGVEVFTSKKKLLERIERFL